MQNIGHFKLKSWLINNSLGWVISMIVMLVLALLGDLFKVVGFKGSQCIIGIGLGCGMGFMQWQYLKRIYGFSSKWFWFS